MIRRNTLKRRAIGTFIACTALMFVAVPALSSGYVYTEDTTVTVGSTQLKIKAGSQYDSLTIGDTSLTVTIAAGEVFELHALYPNHFALENDGTMAVCNVLRDIKDNQAFIRGPWTMTVTPSALLCNADDSYTDNTPLLSMSTPAAGEVLHSETASQLFWSTSGAGAQLVRIRLSSDGGSSYPDTIAVNMSNDGYYSWTVPLITTTDQARLKIEGMNSLGQIVAMAVSPVFTIEGLPVEDSEPVEEPEEDEPEGSGTPSVPDPVVVYDFDPATVTATAATIDVNQAFSLSEGAETPPCTAGMRIKAKTSPAVYFCGADGKRHAFPNQRIHASWYGEEGNWGGVVEITDGSLAGIPLGANVTYRPGVRMVKITTDPKVYAVASDGTLRWVTSEAVATALYGDDWNTKIDDIPDAFFTDYTIGDPIE